MSNPYRCPADVDPSCADTCISLLTCEECGCVLVDTEGGPWGKAMDVIVCLLPIVFLLIATLKRNPLPTTQSLPGAAVMMVLIRLMYLGSDPLLVSGAVIKGLHEAMSPLTIMGGAIMLFETMEATLCMPYILREMKALTKGHPVAELMLLFAFAYMVEGASGFGTPAALGAPMLASLGYPKFESVVVLLAMNTFATIFGAAGTPIWFGFGNLGLSEDELGEISARAGIVLFATAIILLPTMVLTIVCPWRILLKNGVFIAVALGSVTLPALGLSFVSYEFPSLIGGMVGCLLTALFIKFNVGLKEYTAPPIESIDEEAGGSSDGYTSGDIGTLPEENRSFSEHEDQDQDAELQECSIGMEQPLPSKIEEEPPVSEDDQDAQDALSKMREGDRLLGPRKTMAEGYLLELLGRTFPLWATVLLLVITRVQQIGLKDLLTRQEPSFAIYFGTYGTFRVSASLVLQLQNILTYPGLNWKYEVLYIPFFIPFVLVALITMLIHRKSLQTHPIKIIKTSVSRLRKPAIALFGALVLVQMLIQKGSASPASIIGKNLSDALGGGWIAIAAFVGALGSFFSGSTTVSNLTFGEIQLIAADNIGTSRTAMLALQAAGGSAGNGICLNNIIAACAVVGLTCSEGKIIAKTGPPVFCFCVIATLVLLGGFFRF